MSVPDPDDPVEATAKKEVGAASLALGWIVLATSGLCSGAVALNSQVQSLVLPLVFGGPFILIGLGLVALGLRHRTATPGPPPGWHVALGWLMLATSAAGLGVLVVGGGFQLMELWTEEDGRRVVLQLVPVVVIGAGLCLLPGLIGRTLIRPRR